MFNMTHLMHSLSFLIMMALLRMVCLETLQNITVNATNDMSPQTTSSASIQTSDIWHVIAPTSAVPVTTMGQRDIITVTTDSAYYSNNQSENNVSISIVTTTTETATDGVDMSTVNTTFNETDNSTTAAPFICGTKYSTGMTALLGIVIATITTITILGNLLVVYSFFTDQRLRSFGNYFILNLAIADFVVGLTICFYTPYFLSGCWTLTHYGCVVFNVIDYIVPLASAYNMAVISLDRYFSVVYPIQYRIQQNHNKSLAMMSVPWLVGLVVFLPAVAGWEHFTGVSNVPEGQCWVEFYGHSEFLLFVSTVEFIAPFVTVTTLNILIYVNIRRRSRSAISGGGAGQDQAKVKEALARDKKSARSLAILVGVFFVTWAPYEICALVNPICNFCVPGEVFDVVFWLLWTNSTINPIIYPFLQKRFRVAFVRVLTFGRVKVNPQED